MLCQGLFTAAHCLMLQMKFTGRWLHPFLYFFLVPVSLMQYQT